MIYKTTTTFLRSCNRKGKKNNIFKSYPHHEDRVLKETWWFLFIPLYSKETILSTTL